MSSRGAGHSQGRLAQRGADAAAKRGLLRLLQSLQGGRASGPRLTSRLSRVAALLTRALEADASEILILSPTSYTLELLARFRRAAEALPAPGANAAFYKRVLRSRRPIIQAGHERKGKFRVSSIYRLRAGGPSRAIAAPVVGPGGAIGIVAAFGTRFRLDREGEGLVSTAAALLSIPLEIHRVEALGERGEQTLAQLLQAFLAGSCLESFLSALVGVVARSMGAAACRLWLYRWPHEAPYVHTHWRDGCLLSPEAGGYPTAEQRADSPPPWSRLVETREDLAAWRNTKKPVGASGPRPSGDAGETVKHFPLILGGESFGSLEICFPLGQAAAQGALSRRRLLVELLTLAARLKEYSDGERDHAVSEERKRLALEIHDSLIQSLVGIAYHLASAEQVAAAEHVPSELAARLHNVAVLAREGAAEGRRLVWGLQPPALKNTSFAHALKRMANSLLAGTGIQMRFRAKGPSRLADIDVELELLRVAQGALSNVMRHSGATRVQISVAGTARRVEIRISDNGRGFDLQEAAAQSTLGLKSMQVRAGRAGATLKIQSRCEKGTRVIISRLMA